MNIEALTVEVGHLRVGLDAHKVEDAKNFKYSHHMLENLLTKSAASEVSMELLQNERTVSSKVVWQLQTDMDARLRAVERWTWACAGGIAVIALLVGIVGSHIIKLLAGG